MKFNAFRRHSGGRISAVLFTASLLAVTTMGAAKADIAPQPSPSALSQAIMGAARAPIAPVVAPTPPKPAISFAAPLPGHDINSAFGMRELETENHARVHEGVDIAAPQGEAIHATADGQVVKAGLSSSYGNFVEIDHGDGITSFYAHMKRPALVRIGEKVQAGEVLGRVGTTGHSTGPHLHFEIRKDGQHYDPTLFLGHAFTTLASLPFVRSAETGFPQARAALRSSFRLASLHGRRGNGGRFRMQIAAR